MAGDADPPWRRVNAAGADGREATGVVPPQRPGSLHSWSRAPSSGSRSSLIQMFRNRTGFP